MIEFQGIVTRGQKRGRELGFPTANIPLKHPVPEGIYASEVTVDGKTYQAATFIGAPIVFDEHDYKAEAYLLDFSDEIYGKEVTVRLYKKIRDNMRFPSANALVIQMHKDVSAVKVFFAELTQ